MAFIIKPGLAIAWVLYILFPVQGYSADNPGRLYYSIHTGSFTNGTDAEKKLNALKERGLNAFRKTGGDSLSSPIYTVYVGQYTDSNNAVRLWKALNKARILEHFEIHLLRGAKRLKPRQITKTAPIQRKGPIELADRFVDNGDGSVTDRLTNRMWIKKGWGVESYAAITWWDAIALTKRLRIGGYDNWRLPSIEEWQTLLNRARQFPALIEPNPFQNIITHMPYWSRTEFTYGKNYSCRKICPLEAYAVTLYSGSITHQKKADRAFVMAVRAIE